MTKEENDGRRRPPTTAKKSRTLILPKNLEFWKDCLFLKKRRIFDFFHRSVPVMKEENDGRPTTATTDDGKKSNSLILPKNLEFWKDCLLLKNGENLIFFTGPSL